MKCFMYRSCIVAASLTAAVIGFSVTSAQAGTLQNVKQKGFLQCGVSQGMPGFSNTDEKNRWSGLDVDTCRIVSAAVFGDPNKVKYTPLSGKERFTALQSGEIDMLARNSTWTLKRDAGLGVEFAGVNFYDGQGFMVHKSLGVTSALQLAGASACTNLGSTSELNMADFFRSHNMKFTPVLFERIDEVVSAYETGRCDAYSNDRSALAADRSQMKNPADNIILPETISKEPLGPVVREGDDQWLDVVRWSLYAVLDAEELGVNSKNVDALHAKTANPKIRRLLGLEGEMGKALGLSNDWAYNIIKQVGNYAEIFNRNVGPNTPIGLSRGLNALWTDGGLMYGMPIR